MGQPWWWCHFASVAFWVEHTVLGLGVEGLELPEKAGRLVCMQALFGSGNTVRLRVLHAIRQEVVGWLLQLNVGLQKLAMPILDP